jgi:pyruvate/2-oxoglutarate dehydrogenase complex dihydrolipoamide dehydrogenase (E3) component
VARARPARSGVVVTLDDGTEVGTDVVILGFGRRPAAAGVGLETVGVTPGARGEVTVDDQCRAGEGCGPWAM